MARFVVQLIKARKVAKVKIFPWHEKESNSGPVMHSKFKHLKKETLDALLATNNYSEITSQLVRGEIIELEALIGLPDLKRIGDRVDDWDVICQETAENSRGLDEDKERLAQKPLSVLVRAGLEIMRETFGD